MPDAFGIFILPPSEDELLRRLTARNREGEDQIAKRFAEAKHEIHAAKSCDVYDKFIVNENLKEAIEDAVMQVKTARLARRMNQQS